MAEWHDEPLDKRRVCQKRRRTARGAPQALDTLPGEWRELLVRWVRRGGNSRWETLRNDAGVNRVQLSYDLLNWLLGNGWASVIQQWKHGDWLPQQVELLNLPQLRAVLGLRDKAGEVEHWHTCRALLQTLDNPALFPAVPALDALPVQRALARQDLIFKLRDWQVQQQCGTRRDFALFARDATKGISEAEWDWLEQTLDLAEFRIERHTPLLLLAAPLTLTLPRGQLDLASCADFAALTPATVQSITAVSGAVKHWQLVENRTSFERVARLREHDAGVIWLPGYPPGWWLSAVGKILGLAPAPAQIACDPDPDGIAIALSAAGLWQTRSLAWQAWKMSAADLAALPARKPLSEHDRQRLSALVAASPLPVPLAELAAWMQEHDEKGEQEGFL